MNIIGLSRWWRIPFLAAVLAFVASSATSVRATSFSTDQSDLWWVPSESGWGMQLVQRDSVIFATLFVYDGTGAPIWYVATLDPQPTPSTWSGDLYALRGPWFGSPAFNASTVVSRKAGTMNWNGSGTLAYSVDGVNVTKNVVRQPLVVDKYAGRYAGALSWENSCTARHENFAEIVITQVAQNVSINWTNLATSDNCSFAGTLNQAGQFGKVTGTFSCGPVHDDGEFTMTEMTVSQTAFSARYTSIDPDNGCHSEGYVGGIRHR